MEKLKSQDREETFDPLRNLWRNVLIVALEDAVGRHWRNKSFGIAKGNYASSARAWFLEPNRDFVLVCQYAGFDHEYVRMKAKKFFLERKKEDEKNNMPKMHWEWLYKSKKRNNLPKQGGNNSCSMHNV
tara:strand:+ start:40 stop:426 length:387 start_codon:yes stop_codon:yes gene_type:complete